MEHPNTQHNILASHYATREKHDRRKAMRKFLNPAFDVHREAFAALKLEGHESILDAGCGDGEALLGLSKSHSGKLIGIDLNPGMYQETKLLQQEFETKNPIEFCEGSVEALPFANESFAVISSFFMLYHVANLNAALAEFSRALKKNGRLLVTVMGGEPLPNTQSKYRLDTPSVVVENVAEKLSPYFHLKHRFIYEGEMETQESKPLLQALESMREFFVPPPSHADWKNMMKSERQKIESRLKRHGSVKKKVVLGYFIFSPS